MSAEVWSYKQQFFMDWILFYVNNGGFMKRLLQVKVCISVAI